MGFSLLAVTWLEPTALVKEHFIKKRITQADNTTNLRVPDKCPLLMGHGWARVPPQTQCTTTSAVERGKEKKWQGEVWKIKKSQRDKNAEITEDFISTALFNRWALKSWGRIKTLPKAAKKSYTYLREACTQACTQTDENQDRTDFSASLISHNICGRLRNQQRTCLPTVHTERASWPAKNAAGDSSHAIWQTVTW